jgi:hypothetical protein
MAADGENARTGNSAARMDISGSANRNISGRMAVFLASDNSDFVTGASTLSMTADHSKTRAESSAAPGPDQQHLPDQRIAEPEHYPEWQ